MQPLVRRDIWFDSSDSQNKVAGYIYTNPYITPFCVLQISHGMCEYMDRYEEFAGFLTANGVAVCGNDHIGHGSSVQKSQDFGYFTEKDGRRFAITDLRLLNERIREFFPHSPIVMLGHSMGSFFARKYVTKWPHTVDGLILSGTGGPNALVGFGIVLAGLVAYLKGPRYRSKKVHDLAFGQYLKRIDAPKTNYDWISRDEAIVGTYADDPYCTFMFTVNGFHELFSALQDVSGVGWAKLVRRNMPVLMIQGDADPVGNYGRGTAKVRDWLYDGGVRSVEYKIYPGARHEVLNEINRQDVYNDVLEFLRHWWGKGEKPSGSHTNASGAWKYLSRR